MFKNIVPACFAIAITCIVGYVAIRPTKSEPPKTVVEQREYNDVELRNQINALRADILRVQTDFDTFRVGDFANLKAAQAHDEFEFSAITKEFSKALAEKDSDDYSEFAIQFKKIDNLMRNLNDRLEKMERFSLRAEGRLSALETAFVMSDHAVQMNVQKAQAQKKGLKR